MTHLKPKSPHILFLFSDTGGGHRSATEAIIEALELEYDARFTTEMVDIFKYAPPPLNRLPEWYPYIVRAPRAWGLGYRLSDGHGRARFLTGSFWPLVHRATRRLIEQHPSDLIVSVHPLANAPILRALGDQPLRPFITVVTDMVTTHALWYHRRVDMCIVPTEAARRRGLKHGMRPEQMRVVGMPVADRFCHPLADCATLRKQLNWPPDLPVVILVGGGEGMGPLEQTAHAIANSGLPLALVVICGRNQVLQARLEAQKWPIPTRIYGFVKEMPDFMCAADILVTKAGPGTISEAFIAGLPVILYSRLPGQEDGNVTYTVSEGAGVWAPRPDLILAALREWVLHPESRARAAAAARRLARPDSARQIAHLLAAHVGISQNA